MKKVSTLKKEGVQKGLPSLEGGHNKFRTHDFSIL